MHKRQVIKSGFVLFFLSAVILFISLTSISGCKVGPNYKKPELKTTANWSVTSERFQGSIQEQELVEWWKKFNDPNLTSLIERAFQSNLDLKLAQSRVLQARSSLGITKSGLWPSVSASGSYTRSGTVTETPAGTVRRVTNFYQDGLDAIWELDFFGGTRRGIEAANADLAAAVLDRYSVLVTLSSEVALNYINLRTAQEGITIAQDNLVAQQHSAEVTRQKFEGGFVSGLDVANADALVASTASQIPALEVQVRQTIYNLSILLGLEPSALLKELLPPSKMPVAPPEVPAGVPSDLLRRRPDIQAAEERIHSATARIGVATSDLFPRLTLSATGNLGGTRASALTDFDNRSWSVGPSASWLIFSAGSVRSNIELQKALTESAFITYQQTVLAAMQEVENALITLAKEDEHRKLLVQSVNANRKAVDLSTKLYSAGETDFLNVLSAQRSLLASQDALILSDQTVSSNLVALYKALGGGWEITEQ